MKKLAEIVVLGLLCQGCISTTTSTSTTTPQSDEAAAIANLNLGVGYLRQGRADLAVDILERALSFDPRLADAHSSIAVAYDQLGQPDEAEEHYRRATRLEPNNPGAANSYAVFLCRHDRWDDAERYFRRAAENPRYTTPAAALANAGVCARAADESDVAERYFREALARNPGYPDALYHMTDLAYQDENFLQARAFMQRYLESATANPEMLWLCFQIEQQLDSPIRAQTCATRLRDQFPESAQATRLFRLERDATTL
ncbi:MAG: type IV pilus biogenesis/stability protein PilW [Gammaproteobacteria bacterium]